MSANPSAKPAAAGDSSAPAKAGLVLGTLILVAAVANLPLAMANVALPSIGAIAIGVVGPTAGRFLIDLTAEKSAKQFVRGERFVGTAVLTSVVYLICFKYFALSTWPATPIAFAVGFLFRVAAI